MCRPLTDDREAYLMEYSERESVAKYVTGTAGDGIQFVLAHVYGRLYSQVIDSICLESKGRREFRVLEYGCGAGMNLLYIVRLLLSKRLPIAAAIGTDFSAPLLQAADSEKEAQIDPKNRENIRFLRALNESLLSDLAKELSVAKPSLCNSFDLVVGVNTFRYAMRLHRGRDCANDIADLLAPGGYSIMIDMNDRFPLFRSKLGRDRAKPGTQTWLPSLEEYAATFRSADLEIIQATHFCWIPHSASGPTLLAARVAAPFLQLVAPSRAMRSLVVARKRRTDR